jgi:hypothetical protein
MVFILFLQERIQICFSPRRHLMWACPRIAAFALLCFSLSLISSGYDLRDSNSEKGEIFGKNFSNKTFSEFPRTHGWAEVSAID